MYAIELHKVTKCFGNFTAVSDINLHVEPNRVYGFLGPNGAGKTTTIRMLVGLSKPDTGSIILAGLKVHFGDISTHKLFGYLPEQPSFYNWMSGYEYLSFVADLFKLSSVQKSKRIIYLLKLVDLLSAQKKKIGTYSNGMKQRLAIAQALVHDPEILILDEPVSALDPIGRKEVLNVLGELKKNKTIFMSTHILSDVDRICDDVAIINKGKIILESPLSKLKASYAVPILEVEFEKDPRTFIPDLVKKVWVKKCEQEGNHLKIWLKDNKVLQGNIPLKTLTGFDIGILHYGLKLPDIEDLFIELVQKK